MRIAGGIGRGQRLKVPAGTRVRPTSDKVKQALFNILSDRVEGASLLDLFAGAGGIGIEALSRGAGRVTFVDGSRESVAAIKHNVDATNTGNRAEVVQSRADAYLTRASGTFDIVFLDPPYAEELQPLLEQIAASGVLKPDGIVIAEHFKKQPSPRAAGALALFREARYGDTVLAFYTSSCQGPSAGR
ncbi:MAG TPA: 16S rRNA (guanine(966)-N(2))-methyltransferase RsmD [Nitrospirota bacterium]|nr:16S rRNA (guanine(966)-N(2))-methyltransferase RsmD [Nitrospirota bacterium]